jgi:aryl carrier-like protein
MTTDDLIRFFALDKKLRKEGSTHTLQELLAVLCATPKPKDSK